MNPAFILIPLALAGTMPRGYVGVKRCGSCHQAKYASWKQDWHARALSPARPSSVVGPFDDVHFQSSTNEAWMLRPDSSYAVRTRDREGALRDYPVQWVIGGKRMQDPLTVFPDGRWQVLPIYYHVTKNEWVDYNENKQGPVGPEHPFFWTNFRRMANRECLDCHATGVEVSYDSRARRFTTSLANPGVGCESCHGPGAKHASSKEPEDIVQPREIERDRGFAICAQCHGPREPFFPILDSRHRFRPGNRYEDSYQVVMVTDGQALSPDFFPDGRPSSSSFEYQALLQSACYREGGATCLSCHTSPHAEHGENELPLVPPGSGLSPADATCAGCHESLSRDRRAHTHHSTDAGQSCVACHMPQVVSGVLDQFADHALDVPSPANTKRHGVPNACNLCHADASPDSMAQALTRWWPDASKRQARRLRLADAFDPAAARDSEAPLRAVIADSLEVPSLRGAAGTLLALRFPAVAAQALGSLLRSREAEVRSAGAKALGYAPPEVAQALLPRLTPLLHDDRKDVRVQVAEVLAFLDAAGGVDALRAIARDEATAGLVQPHYLLGTAAARHGDLPTAEAEFRRVIELQFYNTYAMLALAQVCGAERRWAEADSCLREVVRLEPDNTLAARMRAAIPSGALGTR